MCAVTNSQTLCKESGQRCTDSNSDIQSGQQFTDSNSDIQYSDIQYGNSDIQCLGNNLPTVTLTVTYSTVTVTYSVWALRLLLFVQLVGFLTSNNT